MNIHVPAAISKNKINTYLHEQVELISMLLICVNLCCLDFANSRLGFSYYVI